jgi:hypothetical protein
MRMLGNTLVSAEEMEQMRQREEEVRENRNPFGDSRNVMAKTAERMDRILRGRSTLWVLGTSLGFEAALLLLAGWIFRRRDY